MARRTQVHSFDDPSNDVMEDLDSPKEIEAGTLAISTADDQKESKEFWEKPKPLQCNATEDGSSVLRFEILSARIMPDNDEDLKVKRFVVYKLTVRQDSSSVDTFPVTIERRYTDFRKLYQDLRKDYPNEMLAINFPNKVFVGNFSTDLVAERGAAFEVFLTQIASTSVLRDSQPFLHFLQDQELTKACQFLDERRNESAVPLLENSFRLLNKIFTDRSRPVLLMLCRLVAACTTSPQLPHADADRYGALALRRFETLSDIDLLPLYIPLLHTMQHLWWQRGRDQKPLTDRLTDMHKKGINVNNNNITLLQAIHKLDPRTETS